MDNNSYKIPSNKKPFSPVMKKLIFLVVFASILLIPLLIVGKLIDNRGKLFNQTVTEIGNELGKSKKIIAPVISL